METSDPEVVYAHMRTHPKVLVKPVALFFMLLAVCVVVTILVPPHVGPVTTTLVIWCAFVALVLIAALPNVVAWWFSTYTVTTRAVRSSTGFISRTQHNLPISRISAVTTEQGVLDRIFKCGTLVISDPATPEGVRFRDIPHVQYIRSVIDDLINGNPPSVDGT